MIRYKSIHSHGLDKLIFDKIKNIKTDKNYYLYIYDNVSSMSYLPPKNFYERECSNLNTWNYDLCYESFLNKPMVLSESVKFGFGDYSDDGNSDFVVVKPTNITYNYKSCPHNSQTHKISRKDYERNYDKKRWFPQKILSSNSSKSEELNIFVIRNLETRKLYTLCYMCTYDKNVINRKTTNCNFTEVDYPLDEKFIDYCNHIKIDYGRIELIKDVNIGWCIIDVNNSPGSGPSSVYAQKKITNIFASMF